MEWTFDTVKGAPPASLLNSLAGNGEVMQVDKFAVSRLKNIFDIINFIKKIKTIMS